MEHRDEMSEWLVRKDNAGLGYETETREWIESGVDPAPRLKDKMIFNRRPPEEVTVEQEIGNEYAESGLLSVTFHDPTAVEVLKQLSPNEFTNPLNQIIAKTVVHLESKGIRADANAVEDYMRLHLPSSPEWDSQMPKGNVDRTNYGLQSWEKGAGVYENAKYYAAEIRSHSQASQTAEVGTWIQERMSAEAKAGIDPERTKQVQREIRSKIDQIRPDLPQAGLASPSPDWKIRKLSPAATSHPSRTTSRTRT
jgi:hypothetical protein